MYRQLSFLSFVYTRRGSGAFNGKEDTRDVNGNPQRTSPGKRGYSLRDTDDRLDRLRGVNKANNNLKGKNEAEDCDPRDFLRLANIITRDRITKGQGLR